MTSDAASCPLRSSVGSPHLSTLRFPHSRVTFLLQLPWGGTRATSVPLLDIPVLTESELLCLKAAERGEKGACGQASSSVFGLYTSGSFLLNLAAASAGLRGDAAASELRLLLQQREVRPSSRLPLETVVGEAAAAAVAASRGVQGATAAFRDKKKKQTEETDKEGAPPLCSLWLLFRLRGGKGGFGALLKKQQRKKRANFSIDACRDLTGRRIRQAQVVPRIKAWMEKKRKEEALVQALAQDTPQQQQEAKPDVLLDGAFIEQQLASIREMPETVQRGLREQLALREKLKAEQRARAAAPQNRTLFAQLRDAVEVDSEEEEMWSEMEEEQDTDSIDQQSSSSSSSRHGGDPSSAGSSASSARPETNRASARGRDTATEAPSATSSTRSSSSSSSTRHGSTSSSSSSKPRASPQPEKHDDAAQAMMQQLEQMRLKAALLKEAERKEREAAAAEQERLKAEAEKAAAENAMRISREAQQLDVSRFSTAEELASAVDEAVVKEKLKQLGWKCGGRPEERAARLLQLKTVDLANVPKALLARQPLRRG